MHQIEIKSFAKMSWCCCCCTCKFNIMLCMYFSSISCVAPFLANTRKTSNTKKRRELYNNKIRNGYSTSYHSVCEKSWPWAMWICVLFFAMYGIFKSLSLSFFFAFVYCNVNHFFLMMFVMSSGIDTYFFKHEIKWRYQVFWWPAKNCWLEW